MNVVQIMQGETNGFVTVIPGNVQVIQVDDIDDAKKTLSRLVAGQLKELDVDVEPVVDGEYRNIDTNEVLDTACEDDDDYYYIKDVTEPSPVTPVAEIYINESATQYTWFIVE